MQLIKCVSDTGTLLLLSCCRRKININDKFCLIKHNRKCAEYGTHMTTESVYNFSRQIMTIVENKEIIYIDWRSFGVFFVVSDTFNL